MTDEEADKILAQGYGATNLGGMLRVHEALLVKQRVPEQDRAAILESIEAAYTGRAQRAVDQNFRE